MGCCAHVASVVWYFGYQWYSEMKSTQLSKLLSVVTDASDLPVTDSESDGDSAVEEWRFLHPDLESLCCELRFIL